MSFGAPTSEITVGDLSTPDVVFQIGLPSQRIDILTSISGVEFADAWNSRMVVEIDGISVPVLGLKDLLINKLSSGREKDLVDLPTIKRLLG